MENDENQTVDEAVRLAVSIAGTEAAAGQDRLLELRRAFESGAITVEQFQAGLAEERERLESLEMQAEAIGAVAGVDVDLLRIKRNETNDEH